MSCNDLAGNTKENYRACLRLHVRPAFEHYTLAEVTTGRVEWFLAKQAKVSPSQAKQTRTMLNMLFGYALRHDAIARNPVEGTSQLRRAKATPQALTLEQIAAIREAAARWRSEPGLPAPKPDGQVRDIIEVLLGTAMRPGEVLALRPCDIDDRSTGMIANVKGTVIQRKGSGAERQPRAKTDASIRSIPVPEFAAAVLRRRIARAPSDAQTRPIFASRSGGPLRPYNVRRTFREFLQLASLGGSGISLRWFRRTGAAVIARGVGTDAAAAFLGHTNGVVVALAVYRGKQQGVRRKASDVTHSRPGSGRICRHRRSTLLTCCHVTLRVGKTASRKFSGIERRRVTSTDIVDSGSVTIRGRDSGFGRSRYRTRS